MHLTKRQREILDFIDGFISGNGYAPSIAEIGRHFGLSSPATVHAHLANLQRKGAIRKAWNRSRSIELTGSGGGARGAVEVPLLGTIAAGEPLEAVEVPESIALPEDLTGGRGTYVLRVRGESMIGEQIRDGDFVIVERREEAAAGETVVTLIDNDEATLKKYRRRGRSVILEPAGGGMAPLVLDAGRVKIQGVVIAILRKY